MNSSSYIVMLNHFEHTIIKVKVNEYRSFFFVELRDVKDNLFGFQWTLEKVIVEGQFKDCWMTSGVSQPISLSKSV